MTAFGLVGILISMAGFYFARANESRSRFILFVLLLLMHIGAAIITYLYVQEFGGDARLYYHDELRIYGYQSGLSTVFLVNFTQTLKTYLGGSFFDYFLLFQAMGFWGLLFILRAFDDIHEELGQPTFSNIYLLLFLPGLHYWTSAIGKDAPIFLGVAMCVWAAFRLPTRYVAFAAGVLITLPVRPHIALMALIAFAVTLSLGRNTSLLMRAGLMVVVLAGIGSVAGLVEGTVSGLSLSSTDSVSEFLESKSQVSEESGADVAITGASFPIKLLSLLFRPFFIDANGAMGYVASLENLVLLLIVLTLIRRAGTALAVFRSTLFARFALVFFVILTFLLALVNYNVGLGLRQKMMMMPALLVFFAALMAVRAVQKGTVYGPGGAAYALPPEAAQDYRRA
ncbi:MAG TPA: hypothetical protein VFQ67_05845 [Allosphingosinicella sp.]|jgi:hypothetical protein|nr:hypothetical protein [Allosphingosinicella sp.]